MNKIFLKLFLLAFLLNQLSLKVAAQDLGGIEKAFTAYNQKTFNEKIFVQTDKETYVTGEIIWFKIYAINATSGLPDKISKIVYVDVTDGNRSVLLEAKISLKDGKGDGSFFIPIGSTNGTYKFRAYTNWMKNFGPDVFFDKNINIINTLNSPEKPKVVKADYDLQFFPEGGDLIEGMPSKVGFKALGTDGKSIALNGIIISDKNDTVARFQTLKFGMGQFSFTPSAGRTYKAIATSAQREIIIKALPVVKKEGYFIAVSANNDQLSINAGTNLPDDKLYLFVHNDQNIVLSEILNLTAGKASVNLKKDKLSDGISYFTLFNKTGKPVSERLYFKKPEKKLDINTTTDLTKYATRKKVSVAITAKNNFPQQQGTDLSISVRRLDSLNGQDQADIVSYMWLSANLKGNIESPNYYFNSTDPQLGEAIENLMLTQGWRRFKWDDILNKKTDDYKFLPEFNGHLITGNLTDVNGKPGQGVQVYMGVPGKRVQFYGGVTNLQGEFKFNTKDYYGQNELIVQTNYERDSIYKIAVHSPFADQYRNTTDDDFSLQTSQLNDLRLSSLGMQVQNVYSGNNLKKFYYPEVDSSAFYFNPYKIYKLSDYVRFTTMEEVLREYVSQIFVYKKQKRFHLHMLDETGLLEDDPLVLLDGVPYFNIDRVLAIDPLKVEKLSVIRSRYYYGAASYDGILSFTTPKADLGGTEIDPHALVLDYEGMQLQREFYSPQYETADQINSRLPDFRNVLYWSPNVPIDAQGKGQVSFYTADQPGKYIGIIQGITSKGIPGSKYFTFEVTK
jgi:hypothetical protein